MLGSGDLKVWCGVCAEDSSRPIADIQRSLSSGFDRLTRHYLAFVHIAASMLWMR